MTEYVILFEFPEGRCYAGVYKGTMGFAPTVTTAWVFDDRESARKTLENYTASREFGKVVLL